eukprot:500291-Pyramimonas_sp.AAC.1
MAKVWLEQLGAGGTEPPAEDVRAERAVDDAVVQEQSRTSSACAASVDRRCARGVEGGGGLLEGGCFLEGASLSSIDQARAF